MPTERQRSISPCVTGTAGVHDLRALDPELGQFQVRRAKALEAAASADHISMFNLIILKLNDIHDLFANAYDAAILDRFQRLARLDGEDRGLLIHGAQDRAIAIHPLIAGEEGDRFVAQDQDDAQRGENGQQAAGDEANLNADFVELEAALQTARMRLSR